MGWIASQLNGNVAVSKVILNRGVHQTEERYQIGCHTYQSWALYFNIFINDMEIQGIFIEF